MRNLVVAATGTGKTVVAALDYRRAGEGAGRRVSPSLLFVAHRERDPRARAGDLPRWCSATAASASSSSAARRRAEGKHVFASIQSLTRTASQSVRPDAFDIVIVDEFHHAAAPTPTTASSSTSARRILLGLTATPERADGRSILHYFDGRIAVGAAPLEGARPGPPRARSSTSASRARRELTSSLEARAATTRRSSATSTPAATPCALRGRSRSCGTAGRRRHDARPRLLRRRRPRRVHGRALQRARASRRWPSAPRPRADERRGRASQRLESGELSARSSPSTSSTRASTSPTSTPSSSCAPPRAPPSSSSSSAAACAGSEDKPCLHGPRLHRQRPPEVPLRPPLPRHRRRHPPPRREAGRAGLPLPPERLQHRPRAQRPAGRARQHPPPARRWAARPRRGSAGPRPGRRICPRFLDGDGLRPRGRLRRRRLLLRRPPAQGRVRRRARSTSERRQLERALARILHIDDAHRLSGYRALLAAPEPPRADPSNPAQRMLFVLLGHARQPLSALGEGVEGALARGRPAPGAGPAPGPARRPDAPPHAPLPGTPREPAAPGPRQLHPRRGHGRPRRAQQQGRHHAHPDRRLLSSPTPATSSSSRSRRASATTPPRPSISDYPLSPASSTGRARATATSAPRRAGATSRSGRLGQHARCSSCGSGRLDDRGETAPYLLLGPVRYRSHRGERPMQIEWELEHAMPARDFQEMKVAAG